jgi:hypothetical protein
MARLIFRIVSSTMPRRAEPRTLRLDQGLTLATALVRADKSPELAARLGQFALQFLH